MNSIKKIIIFSLISFVLLFFFLLIGYYIYRNFYNFNYSRILIFAGSIISGLIIAFLSKSIKEAPISMLIGGVLSLVINSFFAINKILLEEEIGIISEAETFQGFILGRIIILSLAILSTIGFSYPFSLKKPKEEEKITKKIEEGVMVEKIQVREIPEEVVEEEKEEIKEEAKIPTPEEKIESFLPKEEIKKEIAKEVLRTFPEFKNCPYCNSRIPFEAIFCPKCGKKVVS
ncbi:MAG: zinc ribbon domain-containing protein [Nitrososphaerota archaeon]